MLQRGGICDIRCQAFWTSVIKNEEAMRRKWYNKNKDLLLENFKLEDQKLQELKQQLSSKKSSSKKSFDKKKKQVRKILSLFYKKKKFILFFLFQIKRKAIKSDGSQQEKDTINYSFMKPIDLKVKNILYESGVESYAAANNYLRER